MIDVDALKEAGIGFGWTKGVNRRSVSELALSFMIALLRKVPESSAEVRRGIWRQHVGTTLTSKTVGIVGCGNVGKDLIRLLQPFNCTILIHDIVAMPDFAGAFDCAEVTLDELLQRSDIVTVHTPLDHTSRDLIGQQELDQMRDEACLLNTARGGIINEDALLNTLQQGRLGGVALDVFAKEPPETDTAQSLIAHEKVLVVPHIGGSASEAILAMGRAAIDGLDEYE